MKKHLLSIRKKGLSILLSSVITVSCTVPLCTTAYAEENDYQLANNIQDGTILHCFDWKYSDITTELENIARAGFTSIQVSPAQKDLMDMTGWQEYTTVDGKEVWKTLNGTPWYSAYDADELKFCDKGEYYTREDLIELCEEADKYGINIIMDVVANHLNRYYHEDLGDELSKSEYWHNGKSVSNYDRRSNITNGNLGNLPDLNTENEYIQQLTLDYINDLKSMGVDGIRWDAAKHIALPSEGSDFWKIVTDTGLYNYGEILTGPVDNKDHDELMAEYTEYMSVTDSKYSENLFGSFNFKKVPQSDGNWTSRGVTADKLVYWGESHDSYSNNGQYGGTNYMSQNTIDRAYAVAAARADATSLYFSRPSSTEKEEIYFGEKGSMHFISAEVSAVNHFHNAMIGKKDCYLASENCAVITRENGGAVIVCGDETGEVTVENAGGYAVEGTYTDEVSGNTFVVTKDTITGTVGDSGIAVIYDSPFIGRVYAEPVKSNKFFGEINVTLRNSSVSNSSYTLTETRNGKLISTLTKDFSDGDICTFGKNASPGNIFTLELNATAINGREIKQTYTYYVDPNQRNLPKNTSDSNRITFDNGSEMWSDVFVYISCETENGEITNVEFPGEKMEDEGEEYYTYIIPEKFAKYNSATLNITFSDGYDNTINERIIPPDEKYPIIMCYNSWGVFYNDKTWEWKYHGPDKPKELNDLTSNCLIYSNEISQWDDVYIFLSNGTENNSDFPGEKMTDISNNFFSYSIPEKLKDCNNLYVTFNDGKGNSINQWLTMHWDYKSGKIDYIPQDIRTAYNAVGYYYNYPYLDYDDLKTLKWRCYWSTSYAGIIGDFNNDGKISSKDALGILRSSIGYDVDGWYLLGNVNDDDKLTAADSLEVLRYTINAHCSENIGKALLQ